MSEEWKAVEGFEGFYEVSNRGHVRSIGRTAITVNGFTRYNRGVIIKPSTNNRGYLRVNLCKTGMASRYKSLLVHRLVAIAFLPTEDRTQDVNHKDGNKKDCAVTNLEWLPHDENLKHAREMRLNKCSHRVNAHVSDAIIPYDSIRAAQLAMPHLTRTGITKALNSGKLYKGTYWSRIDG